MCLMYTVTTLAPKEQLGQVRRGVESIVIIRVSPNTENEY